MGGRESARKVESDEMIVPLIQWIEEDERMKEVKVILNGGPPGYREAQPDICANRRKRKENKMSDISDPSLSLYPLAEE